MMKKINTWITLFFFTCFSMAHGTDLHQAVNKGDINRVKLILFLNEQSPASNKSSLDRTNNVGETALEIAVKKGHTEIVRLLLETKADANRNNMLIIRTYSTIDGYDYFPKDEVLQLLIDAGARVDALEKGETLLFWAAYYDNPKVAQKLLNANADIDAIGKSGRTALIEALYLGHSRMLRFLLASKADVNIRAPGGRTALLVAISEGRKKDIKAILSENPGSIIAADGRNNPAMFALTLGQEDLFRELLRQGGSIDFKNLVNGSSILYLAVSSRGKSGAKAIIRCSIAYVSRLSENDVKLLAKFYAGLKDEYDHEFIAAEIRMWKNIAKFIKANDAINIIFEYLELEPIPIRKEIENQAQVPRKTFKNLFLHKRRNVPQK